MKIEKDYLFIHELYLSPKEYIKDLVWTGQIIFCYKIGKNQPFFLHYLISIYFY